MGRLSHSVRAPPFVPMDIKARGAQNHNNNVRTTPSHPSSLVNIIFFTTKFLCQISFQPDPSYKRLKIVEKQERRRMKLPIQNLSGYFVDTTLTIMLINSWELAENCASL